MNIYSTFYHAPKPDGIEKRNAYIVGGGIAGLAAGKGCAFCLWLCGLRP